MFNAIRKFFERRNAERQAERRKNGFNFAAGMILENPHVETIAEIEMLIDTALDFGDYDDFDKGMKDALNLYSKRATPKPIIWYRGDGPSQEIKPAPQPATVPDVVRRALLSCQKKQITNEHAPAENYKTYDSNLVEEALKSLSAAPLAPTDVAIKGDA